MKLTWKVLPADDGWVRVALSGSITESAQLQAIAGVAGSGPLRLDVGDVEQVNSCGVREWIHFVQQLADRATPLELVSCPPVFVRQLNMISNFGGNARVRSVLLPYWCRSCGHEDLVEHDPFSGAPLPETRPCSACGATAEFDDLPDTYLSFSHTASDAR